jgi:hypothetical protein
MMKNELLGNVAYLLSFKRKVKRVSKKVKK